MVMKKVFILLVTMFILVSCWNEYNKSTENLDVTNNDKIIENTIVNNTWTVEVIVDNTESDNNTWSVNMVDTNTGTVDSTIENMEEVNVSENIVVKTYTMEKVASYNTPEKCRTVINGTVYDVTSFFWVHPGWDENLSKLCWIEWTKLFMEQHDGNQKVLAKLETMYKGELEK